MEVGLTRTATPARIRAELRRRMRGFGVAKRNGCWYVTGPGTEMWRSTSLNTATFGGQIVAFWVRAILDMREHERGRAVA